MNEIAMMMLEDMPSKKSTKSVKEMTHPLVRMVLDDANCFYTNKKYIVERLIPHYKFLRKFSNSLIFTANEKTVKIDLDELINLLDMHTYRICK